MLWLDTDFSVGLTLQLGAGAALNEPLQAGHALGTDSAGAAGARDTVLYGGRL